MTRDTWHLTRDTWHVTPDTWHLTPDIWHVVGGEHNCQLSSSFDLGEMMFGRFGGKGWLNELINELMNDKGECRTAQATPGLLTTIQARYYCQSKRRNIYIFNYFNLARGAAVSYFKFLNIPLPPVVNWQDIWKSFHNPSEPHSLLHWIWHKSTREIWITPSYYF